MHDAMLTMSLNLNGTYQGEISTRPPSCTTPRQPTIYVTSIVDYCQCREFFLIWKKVFCGQTIYMQIKIMYHA